MHYWNHFIPILFSTFLTFGIASPPPPVFVELYYESLCPFCQNFTEYQLYPTWEKLQHTGIMKIAMYPYGHANMTLEGNGMWKFQCQHGPRECELNIKQTCIMSYFNWHFKTYLYYIAYPQNQRNWPEVSTCAKGIKGNTLGHMMGMLTERLNPPPKTVPHILINGKDIPAARHNLTGVVCASYKGTKPIECRRQDESPPVTQDIVKVDCSEENMRDYGYVRGFERSLPIAARIPARQSLCKLLGNR